MAEYVEDYGSGKPLCVDCATGACVGDISWECDAEHCQCPCRADDRARELDDRPADKLAAVAAELAAERDGDPRDLTAERFGPRPGAA
jgi:hypothetical protein